MKVHSTVTVDRVVAAVERRSASLDNPGFCIACGADAEGVEPMHANTSARHAASPASMAPRSC